MPYLPPHSMPLPREYGPSVGDVPIFDNWSRQLAPRLETAGWRLYQWEFKRVQSDPWVLYDPEGNTVAEWLWEPTLEETLEAARSWGAM